MENNLYFVDLFIHIHELLLGWTINHRYHERTWIKIWWRLITTHWQECNSNEYTSSNDCSPRYRDTLVKSCSAGLWIHIRNNNTNLIFIKGQQFIHIRNDDFYKFKGNIDPHRTGLSYTLWEIDLHLIFIKEKKVFTDDCRQGRHFILICEGVRGRRPRGSRGQSPLVGVRGRSPLKPQRFWHFKNVPDMYFCG